MQTDMHYYGTYAMARMAGLRPEASLQIAYAAQYVDDSISKQVQAQSTGARLISVETAHHFMDIRNIDENDQRYIWLPFHFLPGNVGESMPERFICRESSKPAQQMFEHHLQIALQPERSRVPFDLALIGVAAHVYADSLSHFGFAGISTPMNAVAADSIRILAGTPAQIDSWEQQLRDFFRTHGIQGGLLDYFTDFVELIINVGTELATGALGHGPVGTYPDLPFLHWEYTYDAGPLAGTRVERDNVLYFEKACRNLYNTFRRLAKRRRDLADGTGGVEYRQIGAQVKALLGTAGDLSERCRRWQDVVTRGMWNPATRGEAIPEYSYLDWDNARDQFPTLSRPEDFSTAGVYRFYQAASLHLHYVLRELLPAHGIIVV